MNIEDFTKQGFYKGIRARVKDIGEEKIVEVGYVVFATNTIQSAETQEVYGLEDIIEFIPAVSYSPCYSCGAIHHPKNNTLCKR